MSGASEEVQTDFTYINIRGQARTALQVVDVGTGYSETKLVESIKADKLIECLNAIWHYNNGMPRII